MGIADEAAKKRDETRKALLEKEEKKAAKNLEGKKSQATQLIELAQEHEVFNSDDEAYAVVESADGIRQVWPVKSPGYKRLLTGLYWQKNQSGCNKNSVLEALDTIEARGIHEGETKNVYLRVANLGDRLYVDLVDKHWQVVEVTRDGWQILKKSPVNFIRKNGMRALLSPRDGMHIMELAGFLNMPDPQLKLAIAWLLGSLRGRAAYPVMVINGRQGSGKSTASKMLRLLVDPSRVPMRPPPREPRDLVISAINAHLLALDNLSGIDHVMSDQICRFSTGAGFDPRALFTDLDQILIQVEKPVLINGIDELATRPDLAERSIVLNLPVIQKRHDEHTLWKSFEEALPGLLGGLLTCLSDCLKNEQTTREKLIEENKLPRMADFAIWVTAAEQSLGWESGEFLQIYGENQMRTAAENIESNSIATVLLALLADLDSDQIWQDSPEHWKRLLKNYVDTSKKPKGLDKKPWVISPTDLYEALSNRAGKKVNSKSWPQSTRGLKNTITRIADDLKKFGIDVEHDKGSGGKRYYQFALDMETTINTLASLHPQVENWFL